MVNRILKFSGSVGANAVAEKLDGKQPRDGQSFQFLELWTDGNPDVEISLTVHERTLIDSVPADDLSTVDERLVFDLTVRSGEQVAVLGTEKSGAAQDVNVYALIDETGR